MLRGASRPFASSLPMRLKGTSTIRVNWSSVNRAWRDPVHARDRQIGSLRTEHSATAGASELASLTKTEQFYSSVLKDLLEARLPFMIGGGYALNLYTDGRRPTKDLDILRRLRNFRRHGRAEAFRPAICPHFHLIHSRSSSHQTRENDVYRETLGK